VVCLLGVDGSAVAGVPALFLGVSNGTPGNGTFSIADTPALELAQRGQGKRGRKKGGDSAKKESNEATEQSPAMLEGQTTLDKLDKETRCAIGRSRKCGIKLAVKRGLFETRLRPRFPDGLECRDIDEEWAIYYSPIRSRVNYHGGIDMPAPWGTPMIAVAAGTVVSIKRGKESFRGMEMILRHSPEDTGIPLWVYTQYAHFDKMPEHEVGQRVRIGEVLGPTGNSGIDRTGQQSTHRRPAIHFTVWYSANPLYFAGRRKIIPVDGQWMDPNALYRNKSPFNSYSMKAPPGLCQNDGDVGFRSGSRVAHRPIPIPATPIFSSLPAWRPAGGAASPARRQP